VTIEGMRDRRHDGLCTPSSVRKVKITVIDFANIASL
jgi:hypothetical protein